MDVCVSASEPSPCHLQNSRRQDGRVRARTSTQPLPATKQPPSAWTCARLAVTPAAALYVTAAVRMDVFAPGSESSPCQLQKSRRPDGRVSTLRSTQCLPATPWHRTRGRGSSHRRPHTQRSPSHRTQRHPHQRTEPANPTTTHAVPTPLIPPLPVTGTHHQTHWIHHQSHPPPLPPPGSQGTTISTSGTNQQACPANPTPTALTKQHTSGHSHHLSTTHAEEPIITARHTARPPNRTHRTPGLHTTGTRPQPPTPARPKTTIRTEHHTTGDAPGANTNRPEHNNAQSTAPKQPTPGAHQDTHPHPTTPPRHPAHRPTLPPPRTTAPIQSRAAKEPLPRTRAPCQHCPQPPTAGNVSKEPPTATNATRQSSHHQQHNAPTPTRPANTSKHARNTQPGSPTPNTTASGRQHRLPITHAVEPTITPGHTARNPNPIHRTPDAHTAGTTTDASQAPHQHARRAPRHWACPTGLHKPSRAREWPMHYPQTANIKSTPTRAPTSNHATQAPSAPTHTAATTHNDNHTNKDCPRARTNHTGATTPLPPNVHCRHHLPRATQRNQRHQAVNLRPPAHLAHTTASRPHQQARPEYPTPAAHTEHHTTSHTHRPPTNDAEEPRNHTRPHCQAPQPNPPHTPPHPTRPGQPRPTGQRKPSRARQGRIHYPKTARTKRTPTRAPTSNEAGRSTRRSSPHHRHHAQQHPHSRGLLESRDQPHRRHSTTAADHRALAPSPQGHPPPPAPKMKPVRIPMGCSVLFLSDFRDFRNFVYDFRRIRILYFF